MKIEKRWVLKSGCVPGDGIMPGSSAEECIERLYVLPPGAVEDVRILLGVPGSARGTAMETARIRLRAMLPEEPELKPCGWCGSPAENVNSAYPHIQCTDPECYMHSHGMSPDLWNRRAAPPAREEPCPKGHATSGYLNMEED